jgi:DNA-binding MarR family transcriptional regulator
MDINPGTISLYVQRLVEKELVQKEQDGNDRRNWWLSLTRAGRTAYRETITGTVTYTRDFLSSLKTSEQRSLHDLLLKASRGLGFDWQ